MILHWTGLLKNNTITFNGFKVNINELISGKEKQLQKDKFIQFTDFEISEFEDVDITKIISHFHGHTMLKLPPSEIKFFEWLKKNDNDVWNDIWDMDDSIYEVSVDFLSQFIEGKNGFPICDLQDVPNYYFTVKHIKPKGLQHMEDIIQRLENKEKINIEELLLYELHLAPTDIWHFCYNYNLPLDKAKKAISDMEYKGWIVHLSKSQDLMRYIEI